MRKTWSSGAPEDAQGRQVGQQIAVLFAKSLRREGPGMVVEPARCESMPGSDRLYGLAQGRAEGDDAVDVPGRVP